MINYQIFIIRQSALLHRPARYLTKSMTHEGVSATITAARTTFVPITGKPKNNNLLRLREWLIPILLSIPYKNTSCNHNLWYRLYSDAALEGDTQWGIHPYHTAWRLPGYPRRHHFHCPLPFQEFPQIAVALFQAAQGHQTLLSCPHFRLCKDTSFFECLHVNLWCYIVKSLCSAYDLGWRSLGDRG